VPVYAHELFSSKYASLEGARPAIIQTKEKDRGTQGALQG